MPLSCSSPTAGHTLVLWLQSQLPLERQCAPGQTSLSGLCVQHRGLRGETRGVTGSSKRRKTWLCSACPGKHLSSTQQHLHRIVMLLIHSLRAACWRHSWWQTLSPGDLFPLGVRSCSLFLARSYRNADQQCKQQLFLPSSQIHGE